MMHFLHYLHLWWEISGSVDMIKQLHCPYPITAAPVSTGDREEKIGERLVHLQNQVSSRACPINGPTLCDGPLKPNPPITV